ncbi:uncharacterized protein AB675_7253 [Cyphellophora attinorum]|uniref:Nuclear cap-binding protein subunit 3 n=1 Tax=Cyphellophora attinorum TaxID=1664694 RepID=A0A0N1NW58_9EURO|nr:uncharacterized protein AB675_7253 [Phialophora attinorum]KPI36236.1 hypothetical protein AB675_7253 [Phialophora attinorum]
MALTMSSTAAMDDIMDIDIDVDLGEEGTAMNEEFELEEGEEPSFQPSNAPVTESTTNVIPAIYTEDPMLEPQWDRVHIRGLDDMHTTEIEAFIHDNFPEAEVRVQWIDDTSANIVFKSKELAREGLSKLTMNPITIDEIIALPLELRTAKALSTRPSSMLTVRIAQVGDRKKKNAREASRYYLMNPDQDPGERMRGEFANNRPRRRDIGEYERRRFDDREHRRRRRGNDDTMNDFAASMYDDAPEPNARGRDLFAGRSRRRSASPGQRNSDEIELSDSEDDGRLKKSKGYRDRSDRLPPYTKRDPAPFPRTNSGKELFGVSDRPDGGLHSDRMDTAKPAESREANVQAAKRMRDHLMSAAQTSPRAGHRRSRAMDAKNAEDLSERFARKSSLSMDSTKSGPVELFPSNGLSIKGSAGQGSGGLSIKGRAEVKELFPDRYSANKNAGVELFDQPIRERRVRRTAGDLFD